MAAAISAIYAYFIMYGASLMTEALYIVCILWSIDAAMRLAEELPDHTSSAGQTTKRPLLLRGVELGVAMISALLLRQVIVAFLGVLVLWLIWIALRRSALRQLFLSLVLALFVMLLCITPVLIRNYRAFHRITSLNTNAGYAFFWSNHPIYGTHFESVLSPSHGVTYQELIPQELLHLDEAALDRELLKRGLQFIADEPLRYVQLSLSRIPVYFLFWPKSDSTLLSNGARLLSFALFLPSMIYGLVLAVSRYIRVRNQQKGQDPLKTVRVEDSPDWINMSLLLLFIAVYSLVHILSWANVRYRLPVDAILIIFAGYGLWDLYLKLRRTIED